MLRTSIKLVLKLELSYRFFIFINYLSDNITVARNLISNFAFDKTPNYLNKCSQVTLLMKKSGWKRQIPTILSYVKNSNKRI